MKLDEQSKPIAVAVVPPVSETSKSQQSTVPAEKELLATLETWRAAWAARDINTYLAHYADTFRPIQGNRVTWLADRRRVIGAESAIELQFDAPQIRLTGDSQAVIVFRQRYRTANLSDVGTKKLTLQQIGDRWLIQRETFTTEAR